MSPTGLITGVSERFRYAAHAARLANENNAVELLDEGEFNIWLRGKQKVNHFL